MALGRDAVRPASPVRVGTVRCGCLVDVDRQSVHRDWLLRVEDEFVVKVGPWVAADREDEVLDLSGMTVIPGLVDCHDHLGFDFGNLSAQADRGEIWATLRAVKNGRLVIAAGITTLRDAGSFGGRATVWRQAIETGYMFGPSLRSAGQWITPTGGHVWFAARQADGGDEVRRAVREQVRAGADWIKLIASGGILTNSGRRPESIYSQAEIQIATDEAHNLGLTIAAHAHGGPGLDRAIAAGVDTIEHGTEATQDQLERMAAQGTSLVATPGVLRVCAVAPALDPETRRRVRQMEGSYLEVLAAARHAGVAVAIGTDLLHGRLADDMEILVEAGYSRLEALRSATAVGAEVAGALDAGRLVEGGRADFLAVATDPLRDFAGLRNPGLVVKGGEIVSGAAPEGRTIG